MKTLLTMATPEYRTAAERLAESGRPYFDRIKVLTPQDFSAADRAKVKKQLEYRRGWGFWWWKSMGILRELEGLGPDDVLMYADSQCVFEADPQPLFDLTRKHDGIGIFNQKRERHKNSTWTRRDCFKLMGCDEPRYHEGDNLASTFSVWTKTDKSIAFVKEWLHWCSDYRVVSDEPSKAPNLPDFKDHRHDQSVMSILAIKYDRFTLDDCSQYGDGFRRPECQYPRILKSVRTVKAPWLRRPTMQSIIEVSTLATCPILCSFCPQDALKAAYQGHEAMTLEMFTACLDNLTPGDAIYFCGYTEPCINKQIIPMLELSIARGHRTRLYTTGRGLKLEDAQRIAAMDLELIVLHLPDSEGHLSHAPANVPILDALTLAQSVQVMTMDGVPHEDVAHIYNNFRRNYGAMHDRAGSLKTVKLPTISLKGPIKCGVAPQLDHPVLLPNGELQLCCMTYSLEHPVGNLSTTPLSEILAGKKIQAILDLQRNGGDVACRRCTCAVKA